MHVRPFPLIEALESRVLLTTDTYAIASLTSMTGAAKNGTGASPQGLVMAPNGDLYGTTITGGSKGYGTLFKITGSGQMLTTVASFKGTDGISPRGAMVLDNAGNLFGTAVGGGSAGKGVVWEVTAAALAATAGSITLLSSFTGANGSYPTSGLTTDASGNLFGFTQGVNNSTKDKAVVFKLVPGAGTNSILTTVAAFDPKTQPAGGLTVDASGDIFGVTRNGGAKKLGSVFEIVASSSAFTTLASFTAADPSPNGTLIVNSGIIYGTTQLGGPSAAGTIFKIVTTGTAPILTTLAVFNGKNGNRPTGPLILDTNGNLFGLTSNGGANSTGALFELSPNGTTSTLTTLFSFKGMNTGADPTGPFIMNASGQFFGTTYIGGKSNIGAVFELGPLLT